MTNSEASRILYNQSETDDNGGVRWCMNCGECGNDCESCDLSQALFIAMNALQDIDSLRLCTMAYEDKLKELMGEKEFIKFSMQVGKDMFREFVKGMADSDFKESILEEDVFNAITGTEEEYWDMMNTQNKFNEMLREEDDDD